MLSTSERRLESAREALTMKLIEAQRKKELRAASDARRKLEQVRVRAAAAAAAPGALERLPGDRGGGGAGIDAAPSTAPAAAAVASSASGVGSSSATTSRCAGPSSGSGMARTR